MTGLLLEAAGPPQPGLTVLRVVLAVIFLAWIVMLVLVLAVAAIVVTNRGRIQRRRALAARLAPRAAGLHSGRPESGRPGGWPEHPRIRRTWLRFATPTRSSTSNSYSMLR